MEIEITQNTGFRIKGVVRGEFALELSRFSEDGRMGDGFDLANARIIVPEIDPIQFKAALDYATAELVYSRSYHPEGIEAEGVTVLSERHYLYKNSKFCIRDIKAGNGIACEYKADNRGTPIWLPFEEGGAFDDYPLDYLEALVTQGKKLRERQSHLRKNIDDCRADMRESPSTRKHNLFRIAENQAEIEKLESRDKAVDDKLRAYFAEG